MFTRLIACLAVAGGLSLAACALTPAQITADIATIQQDCEELCQVVPNTLSVAALVSAAGLPTASAGLADLAAISQAICNAIGPAPASAKFRFAKGVTKGGRAFKVWTPPATPVTINGQTVQVNFL